LILFSVLGDLEKIVKEKKEKEKTDEITLNGRERQKRAGRRSPFQVITEILHNSIMEVSLYLSLCLCLCLSLSLPPSLSLSLVNFIESVSWRC
jgi:hypothetical protein